MKSAWYLTASIVALACAIPVWATPPAYIAIILSPGSGFESAQGAGMDDYSLVGSAMAPTKHSHAILWSGDQRTPMDLNPEGFNTTRANDCFNLHQVGIGVGPITDNHWHAILWQGTAESYIDLTPSGFTSTLANACNDTQQVGAGNGSATGGKSHALLWSGTPESCVDLNPTGFDYSGAYDLNGDRQVGWASAGGISHGMLWNGTAASYVDLHPVGFTQSTVDATSGSQQVGMAWNNSSSDSHAVLWSGTADSCVDLHPAGFDHTQALDTNGIQQVGVGVGPATTWNATYHAYMQHALVWDGNSDSYVDLHQFLPEGPLSTLSSAAYAIDNHGNIWGDAGDYAVLWVPQEVPEPCMLGLLALGSLALIRRRRAH